MASATPISPWHWPDPNTPGPLPGPSLYGRSERLYSYSALRTQIESGSFTKHITLFVIREETLDIFKDCVTMNYLPYGGKLEAIRYFKSVVGIK